MRKNLKVRILKDRTEGKWKNFIFKYEYNPVYLV